MSVGGCLGSLYPALFNTPSPLQARQAIGRSLFTAGVALLAFVVSRFVDGVPFFPLCAFLLAFHLAAAIRGASGNLLFLFRYTLVWILIFATSVAWGLYNGEVKMAPFGAVFQTHAVTERLVMGGVLSVCGSLIGWSSAMLTASATPCLPRIAGLVSRYRAPLFVAGAALAVGFGLLYFYVSGGAIGEHALYAQKDLKLDLRFGVFNVFHYFGISLLLLAGIKPGRTAAPYVWLGVGSLLFGILSGSRADFLPQGLLLIVMYGIAAARIDLRRLSLKQRFALLAFALLALLVGLLIARWIAVWRHGMSAGDALDAAFGGGGNLLIQKRYGHQMLWIETGNMALGTFYAAIVNVEKGLTGLLYGQSYFNYLLSAPPAFLDIPRPPGLEWSTRIHGQIMAQGGIFEVAEAYWNFGLAGCFLVAMFISWVSGRVLRAGLAHGNLLWLSAYIVGGFMGFRAIWYQNFSYFRIFTVMLLIAAAALFIAPWFARDLCPKQSR